MAFVFMFCLAACEKNQQDILDNPQESEPFTYKYVAVIGVDGAGNFFNKTDTPNMDRIFANGATTYTAKAETPTISAQNWGSILHGVDCDKLGFSNDIISEKTIDSTFQYLSIFNLIRQNDKDAELCSVVNWSPINYGLIECDIGVHVYSDDDVIVCNMAKRMISDFYPEFLFVQFDGVDWRGHSNGYGSKEHLDYITVIDGYIGQIYDLYDELGILYDTLFIVVSDHGGTYTISESGGLGSGSHGGSTPEETTVFIGVAGASVANIDLGEIRNQDVAAITAKALNLEIPDNWTSRVPDGLFTER